MTQKYKDTTIVDDSYKRIIEKCGEALSIMSNFSSNILCYGDMAYQIRKINKEIKSTLVYINNKTKFTSHE